MMLSNESEQPIVVVYPTDFESRINPGKEKRGPYGNDCIRIKLGDDIHEYREIMPSDRYLHIGVFSVSINAAFTNDHRLLIYPQGNREEYIELQKGC